MKGVVEIAGRVVDMSSTIVLLLAELTE